jgi:hypothetical protein
MSQVLWNTFVGTTSYQQIILHSMMPDFWLTFGWNCFRSLPGDDSKSKPVMPSTATGE